MMHKSILRKITAILLIYLLAFPINSYALDFSRVQNTMAGILESKMASKGIAATDPRYAATISSVGTQIVGGAAAAAIVTAAGVTAPAWITVAATVALGSVISIAADKTINWLFNSDGTVKDGSTGVPAGTQPKIDIVTGGVKMDTIVANSIGAPYTIITVASPNYYIQTWFSNTKQTNPDASKYSFNQGWTYNNVYYYIYTTNVVTQTQQCPANYSVNGTQCVANAVPVSSSVTDAISKLTPDQLNKPVSPEVMAKLADAEWQKASQQPGYAGVPYDASTPVTPDDVSGYMRNNPTTWPTVSDVVTPQKATDSTSTDPSKNPFALPVPSSTSSGSTGSNPTSGSGSSSGTSFDWTVVAPPESIPKSSVDVTYNPIAFSQSTGCPAPLTFDLFGATQTIPFTSICSLLSSVVAPITITIATIAAAFIFARGFNS